ncbi:hypothetical protein ACYOEI_36320 [Singulisphaera rosea]
MVAWALLMAIPIAMAYSFYRVGRTSLSMASASVSDAGSLNASTTKDRSPRPPSISMSIEPAVLAPVVEVEPPVVFPGYLLPDDDSEEPSHAGS